MPRDGGGADIGKLGGDLVAERTGLEPATPGVTGRYSNQLNYRSAAEGAHSATGRRAAQQTSASAGP